MSYCEVNFEGNNDDCEPVEFLDKRVVKAKKAHRCSECGGEIAVGEHYERASYRFDGRFNMERRCDPCREAAGEFEFNVLGGLLWESFYEEWDKGAHVQACIQRLSTARAKEHMRQQWLKWQERERQRLQRARELRKPVAAVDPHAGDSAE